MKILNTVVQSIERYGDSIQIITDDEIIITRAFVESLRRRNSIFIGGEYHKIGKTEKYLYIGNPAYRLTENKTIIKHKNNNHLVKRVEQYIVNNMICYTWAILSLIEVK